MVYVKKLLKMYIQYEIIERSAYLKIEINVNVAFE